MIVNPESNLPWTALDYYTKKRMRLADAHGNLIHNERTIQEPGIWTADAKMTFAIQAVARELQGTSEEELGANLAQLTLLLPDVAPGPTVKYADMVRVAARIGTAAESLIALREELPGCNVSRMAAQQPLLLLEGPEAVRQGVRRVKEFLAGCGPTGLRHLLEQHPQLLRPAAAAALLDEVVRLFGLEDAAGREAGRARAAALLGANPGLAAAADCLRGQARGDRDPEYLADTTRADM